MKKFARIQNNKVMQIIEADNLPPFHPDVALQFEELDTSVMEGFVRPGDPSPFAAPVILEPMVVPYDPSDTEIAVEYILGTMTQSEKDAAKQSVKDKKI